jgi:hypothetical protein
LEGSDFTTVRFEENGIWNLEYELGMAVGALIVLEFGEFLGDFTVRIWDRVFPFSMKPTRAFYQRTL